LFNDPVCGLQFAFGFAGDFGQVYAPIYLPTGTRPGFPSTGEVAVLKDVQVIPEHEVVADLNP
jgi:hypothetical protein